MCVCVCVCVCVYNDGMDMEWKNRSWEKGSWLLLLDIINIDFLRICKIETFML